MRKLVVLAVALAMVIGMVSMAQASMTVNGSVRTNIAYNFYSSTWSLNNRGIDKAFGECAIFNNGFSRLKFKWASKDKKFSAYMELGMYDAGKINKEPNTEITKARRTEATYNHNGDILQSIMFGYGYVNMGGYYCPGSMAENGGCLWGRGSAGTGRKQQVRFHLFKKNTLELVFWKPSLEHVWIDTSGATPVNLGHVTTYLPTVGLAWNLNFKNFSIRPFGSLEIVSWRDATSTDSYNRIDTGVNMTGDFGLVGFDLELNYGINPTDMLNTTSTPSINATFTKVVDDVTAWSIAGQLRVGNLKVGAGYVSSSRNDWASDPWSAGYFVNYKLTFGPISFTPEIAYLDDGRDKDNKKLGTFVQAMLWTQMDF
jgi:hypothetical protein